MLSRRLAVLLFVAVCLAPCWRRDRAAGTAGRLATPILVGTVARPSEFAAPPGPRPSNISPFAPWRYRLKSVLQESDSRIDRESSLGPLPLPDGTCSAVVVTPRSGPSCAVVPLRC